MDALGAIGLASSIITFIDFGYELISVARDIHGSVTGHSKENTRIEYLNTRMEALAADLSAKTSTSTMTEDEKRLSELSGECLRLSRDLKKLLDKLKVADRHSARKLISSVLRDRWKKDEKKGLEERLDSCRAHLHLQFSRTTWSVFPPSAIRWPGQLRNAPSDLPQAAEYATTRSYRRTWEVPGCTPSATQAAIERVARCS